VTSSERKSPAERKSPTERKNMVLRLDPAVHDALTRWAAEELRSTNAQIEFLLRRTLTDAGRLEDQGKPRRDRDRPGQPGPPGRRPKPHQR
jgi:hypothetical protein